MKRLVLAIGTALVAAGCAVEPVAITDDSHIKRAAEDQRRLFDEQDPVSAPLTLHDAIARAQQIPVQVGTTMGSTDGSALTAFGPVNTSLSWPGRYSHSPAEVLDLRDVHSLGLRPHKG